MNKLLDYVGLLHFWEKLKEKFDIIEIAIVDLYQLMNNNNTWREL